MKKQIVKNLATNYLGNFLGMALGFFVTPFLIRKLGKEAFGITVLAESIIAFFQIFAFSVRISLSRYATIALSQKNEKEFVEYLSTGRRILFAGMILTFLAGTIVSFLFPTIFRVPLQLVQESRFLFFLITIAFAITIPNIVFWSVLYAQQRYDLINISNFGGIILRIICIFFLFSFLPKSFVNIITYGFIYLAMTWGQNFLVFIWSKFIMPDLRISNKEFTLSKVKEIISFSGYSSLGNLGMVFHDTVMNIVVNIFLGPLYNAIYSISIRIPNMLKRLFQEPSASLTPTFTDLITKKDQIRTEMFFSMYLKLINLIIFPLGVSLILFSQAIISAWVGKDFYEAAMAMPYFIIVSLMTIPASVCSCLITAHGTIKIPTFVSLGIAFLNIGLSCFFGFVLKEGIIGIGLATLLSNFLGSVIFLPLYTCRIVHIKARIYFIEAMLKPLILAITVMGGIFLWFKGNQEFLKISLFQGFICLLSNIGVYILGFLFILKVTERQQLKELINSLYLKFMNSSLKR